MQTFQLDSHSYDGRYLRLVCTQEQKIAENTSVIHWTLSAEGGNANYYTTGPTTVKIDGQTVYYAPTAYWNTYQFPAGKGAVSGTLEVQHREDGSKWAECSLETSIYTGVLRTAKADWELDANPRASTASAADCFIGGNCMVLVDRKNSGYTHSLRLECGTYGGYIQSDGTLSPAREKLEKTSISVEISTIIYDQIPTERAAQCTLTCVTYLGDVQIGQPQVSTFRAYAREEDCIPLLDCQVWDANPVTTLLTGNSSLIRFFSRAACRFLALAKGGAYVVKKQIGALEVTGEEVEIPGVESGSFLFQAVDSRGYRGESLVELPLIPYTKLTAKASVKRQAPTSDRVELTVTGNCWQGSFGLEQNDLEGVCRVGTVEIPLEFTWEGDTYTAKILLEGLSYDAHHYVQVTLRDKLMEQSLLVGVNPGVPVFDWGQRDFTFHVPVILADGSAAVSYTQLQQILGQMKGESA